MLAVLAKIKHTSTSLDRLFRDQTKLSLFVWSL